MNIYNAVVALFLSSLETCLSDHLMSKFNFSPNIVGLYFTLYFGGRVLLSLPFLCMPASIHKPCAILISLLLCCVSKLLIGPSLSLGVDREEVVSGLGLLVSGADVIIFSCSF